MAEDAKTLAEQILQGIGGALTSLAPLTTGPWRVALAGIGAAVALAADLVAHDLDPVATIGEIQSVLPDYQAARDRLQELINQKVKK